MDMWLSNQLRLNNVRMDCSHQLTCGEIAAGVGERLATFEHGVRLHLICGASIQVAGLVLQRIVLDRNGAVRLLTVGQAEQLQWKIRFIINHVVVIIVAINYLPVI